MKRFIGQVMGAVMLLPVWFASADTINQADPYQLMEAVANQTFERFKLDQPKITADKNHLKIVVAEELMPYVDYRYAALKAMGRHARNATPEQRQQFVEAFEGYLVATYAQAFTAYTNQTVEFEQGRDVSDEKQTQVDVKVIEAGRPPIKLAFKLRRLKNNDWKAFDMVAEGVSLLRSKTSELDVLIRQQGLDNVINMLNNKAAEPITQLSVAKAA